ncbi:hypothetical protein [Maritimibacter sp. DP1N21-5]|uniref:hypothetical protein n=1 Tax=Maritimibacter sp. DP1N21-5 TaxID=2836867 RepID=UPI001C46C708|nr:hypothetical protein [Maritimibacter sp. DP1N21-5]MBV7411109.1 hypothetical protein [Maritimibacter sp. DP1N21-5]
MRALTLILSVLFALTGPVAAQTELPPAMPPRAAPADIDRNLGFGLAAWEKLSGYSTPSRPDAHVLRDFQSIPLTDGSVVIPGLGVRLRPAKEAGRDVLEIVDMREFSAIWVARDDPPFGFGGIGGLIGGTIFSLDQTLRTELSKSADKKLTQGFSFQISTAVPYEHNGEPRVQIQPGRLRVDPLVRPMGRWLVAEPDANDGPDPRAEYDALIADFQTSLSSNPCSVTGLSIMNLERQIDLLDRAAEAPLPDLNLRNLQETACAIATHGTYDIADLERLAVLRQAECADLAEGLSQEMRQAAEDMQGQVAPPTGYLRWAEIGLYGIRDPSRGRRTPEEGVARKTCILQYLEDDLFAATEGR